MLPLRILPFVVSALLPRVQPDSSALHSPEIAVCQNPPTSYLQTVCQEKRDLSGQEMMGSLPNRDTDGKIFSRVGKNFRQCPIAVCSDNYSPFIVLVSQGQEVMAYLPNGVTDRKRILKEILTLPMTYFKMFLKLKKGFVLTYQISSWIGMSPCMTGCLHSPATLLGPPF